MGPGNGVKSLRLRSGQGQRCCFEAGFQKKMDQGLETRDQEVRVGVSDRWWVISHENPEQEVVSCRRTKMMGRWCSREERSSSKTATAAGPSAIKPANTIDVFIQVLQLSFTKPCARSSNFEGQRWYRVVQCQRWQPRKLPQNGCLRCQCRRRCEPAAVRPGNSDAVFENDQTRRSRTTRV